MREQIIELLRIFVRYQLVDSQQIMECKFFLEYLLQGSLSKFSGPEWSSVTSLDAQEAPVQFGRFVWMLKQKISEHPALFENELSIIEADDYQR